MENAKIRPPVESNPLNRLPKNVTLIMSGRRPPVSNFIQIASQGASRQMGDLQRKFCTFFIQLPYRSDPSTDFHARWLPTARVWLLGVRKLRINIQPLKFTQSKSFAQKPDLENCWKFSTFVNDGATRRCRLVAQWMSVDAAQRQDRWHSSITLGRCASSRLSNLVTFLCDVVDKRRAALPE